METLNYRWLRDQFYQALKGLPYGTLLSYAQLTEIASAPATDHRVRSALLTAGRRLLKEEQKLLLNIRNVGYEIAPPNAHVGESRRQQQRARRRMRRALDVVTHVEVGALNEVELHVLVGEQTRVRLKLAIDRTIDAAKALPDKAKHADVITPATDLLKHYLAKN